MEETAAAAATTAAAAVDAAAAPAAGSDEPLRNKQEVVELRKEVRGLGKQLADLLTSFKAQAAPAVSPPAAAPGSDVEQLRSQVTALAHRAALADAMASAGMRPGSAAAELLAKVSSGRPPEEITTLAEMVGKAVAPPAAVGAPPAGRSDTGPPGVTGQTSLPGDINRIDPSVWRGLSLEDRRARTAAYLATLGNANWLRGASRKA